MKYLWALVSCYLGVTSDSGSSRGSASGTSRRRSRRRPSEEIGCSVRRRRRTGSGQGEWRPTLCSIMEDKVVVAERARARARGGKSIKAAAGLPKPGPAPVQPGNRRSGGGSRSRVHERSDDHGGASPTATPIPAFSPTTFMF